MKKVFCILATVTIFLTACSQQAVPTWQEQYDLGVRYLSEGNYEEAIIAFTAAIEIDPKQSPAYVGRGDAYVGVAKILFSDDTQGEEFTAKYKNALSDYLTAIDLGSLDSEVYMKAAEVYIALGDVELAIAMLEQGFTATGDETLQALLNDLQSDESDTFWTHFEMLEPGQQQYLETLVLAVEQENTEVAWKMLQSAKDIFNDSVWVEFNAYRLNITPLSTAEIVAGDIEIRPESGKGFYCSWSCVSMSSTDTVMEEYGYGQCEGWNWNGQYALYGQSYDGWKDYYFNEIGSMNNGLIDGTVSRTSTSIYSSTGERDISTREVTFKDGVYIEGNPYDMSDIYGREGDLYSGWGIVSTGKADAPLSLYLWNLWD